MHELQQPKLIKTGHFSGPKGNLSFLEIKKELPFEPQRVYWVDRSEESGLRGNHAHLNSSRVFSAISGEVLIRIFLKDGREKEFILQPWSDSLWIPPGFWYECHLNKDSILLVISSHTHDDDIYLRDKEAYLAGYCKKQDWVYSHNYLPNVYKRSYPISHYAIRRYQYIVNHSLTEIFYLARGREILGRWPFQINNGVATSLTGAPYGGMQVNEEVPLAEVKNWVKWVIQLLPSMGVRQIKYRSKPSFLQNGYENRLQKLLISLGFNSCFSDASQYIITLEDLAQKLHPMEQRKLKQSEKQGLRMLEESAENLPEVFFFIAQARYSRDIPLNTTLEKLQELFKAYPDKYFIFSVFDKKNIRLATCIAVWQSDNSLYYFLPATGIDFMSESPMVFLIVSMANWCEERNIDFLDLGISSIEGHLQQGLYDFKKRMGAIDAEKWTFELELD